MTMPNTSLEVTRLIEYVMFGDETETRQVASYQVQPGSCQGINRLAVTGWPTDSRCEVPDRPTMIFYHNRLAHKKVANAQVADLAPTTLDVCAFGFKQDIVVEVLDGRARMFSMQRGTLCLRSLLYQCVSTKFGESHAVYAN